MNTTKEKIKDEALKQLFKLKLDQLSRVQNSFVFTHPIAQETIWLFSHSFENMYQDPKMLSILHDAYVEFQTNESREELLTGLKKWADEKGYDYNLVFK